MQDTYCASLFESLEAEKEYNRKFKMWEEVYNVNV
ncbi:hypothetical protein cd3_078 [Carnobacterium phage cd3]|uniref:Uncharacterized protein n=1 Tax=Carnobacterium phage cd2 TaxID=2849244 RepID=A0AAE7SQC9_9CAUD|nr:hypothetical protein PQD68_gp078 [Carnobacterium phage cd2]QXP45204.1 hypothetical protein cd2_078 [Carnobacterium phage cd2]QXP45241.1 hypothetical protein cd3_078 [Carnobacterium phage cd3]